MRKATWAVLLLAISLAMDSAIAQLAGPMSAGKPPEAPASGANPSATPSNPAAFDVEKLFANTCGWCHSNAGRTEGRGPKLAGSKLTDAEIIVRIKQGKTGAMPAFAGNLDEGQLRAIVQYIRGLKEDGATK
jgi:mono/diheme cytochrome c family protein